MAKERLTLYDKYGNVIEYDISSASVTIDAEGKTLDIKLSEIATALLQAVNSVTFNGTPYNRENGKINIGEQMQADWNESSASYPTFIKNKPNVVTGVKMGQNGAVNTPSNGVVTLPEPGSQVTFDDAMSSTSENGVQNKVIKAYVDAVSRRIDTLIGSGNVQGAIDTFNEVVAFLNGINSSDTLAAKLALKANSNEVVKSITVNGQTQQKDQNGNVNIEVQGGGLSKEDISVESQGDGTVEVNVGRGADKDTYTINLNHTHENMCKLVVCEESGLPSTLDNSTIYAITDSGETEIEKLIIRGMEFTGGGVPDTGEPMISSPSNGSTINLGTNDGSGVSKTITIKGKNLTGDLTVTVGTGLTITYGQSTGQSSVTIPMAQALLGAQVTIAYSGTGALDDGSLVISHGNNVLSSVVVVVVVKPVTITAVKFTKQQIVTTDIYPSPNSRLEIDMQFDGELNNFSQSTHTAYFMGCPDEVVDGSTKKFNANTESYSKSQNDFSILCWFEQGFNGIYYKIGIPQNHVRTRSVFSCDQVNARASFNGVSISTERKTTTMSSPLNFGGGGNGLIFGLMDIIVYSIKHYENNVLVHNYVPVIRNGVAGLYDNKTDTFIHSTTGTELEIVQ